MKKHFCINIIISTLLAALILLFLTILYRFIFINSKKATPKDNYEYIDVCWDDTNDFHIINSVYSQLDAPHRGEILDVCHKTIIDKIPFTKKIQESITSNKNTSSYISKDVYKIIFDSKNFDSLGDLIVFADIDSYEIIAYALRD